MSAGPFAAAALGTASVVAAQDLHLSFGSTLALRGASLTVRRGEIVAVIRDGTVGTLTGVQP